MEKHEYEYDKVVIGGSLASLVYAYHEALPIVWTEPRVPYFFEKTKDGLDKSEIWKRMAFLLSLSGLAPLGDKVEHIREEDGILKVYGKEPYFIKMRVNEVVRFDENLVEKEDTVFEVIDWVNVRSGMVHPHHYLNSGDNFVNHVYFYKTERVEGNHDMKDLVALSYMTRKQLQDLDYSETYVRLKLIDMMKAAGIKGTGNGFWKGKKRYLSIKLEPVQRDVRICDTEREDKLLKKYNKATPPHEQLAMWADALGSPYERD